jgi:hypothetical protein
VDIEERRRSARVSPIFPTFSLGFFTQRYLYFSLQGIWIFHYRIFGTFSLQEMSLSCTLFNLSLAKSLKLFDTCHDHHIKRQEVTQCTLERGLLVLVVNCLLVVNLKQFQFWGFQRRAGWSLCKFWAGLGNQVREFGLTSSESECLGRLRQTRDRGWILD